MSSHFLGGSGDHLGQKLAKEGAPFQSGHHSQMPLAWSSQTPLNTQSVLFL